MLSRAVRGGQPTLFRAADDEEAAIWDKLVGPIAGRFLSRDRFTKAQSRGCSE
jgi:hypothetical protein